MDTRNLLTTYARDLDRVLLYGPPGTGKTHLAMHAGQPAKVQRVGLTEETPAAELRGYWVPAGTEWRWHDGPVMTAYRTGGRLVIDEITRAHDDAWSFLLTVLDGHPLTLPNGETVSPHPDLSVWATTNEHPDVLPPALADRFPVKVKIDTISPAALEKLPPLLSRAVSKGTVTYRQAHEYNRLSKKMSAPDAAALVFEKRASDVLYALQLGASVA